MVSQGGDCNQIVLEIGHDVSGGGGQVGEEDVTGGGGEIGGAAGGADNDSECVGAYVGARGFWREVEAADPGVCYCSVGRRHSRWVGGWATASSRW